VLSQHWLDLSSAHTHILPFLAGPYLPRNRSRKSLDLQIPIFGYPLIPAFGERATLYGKLDDFQQECRKQFWGPHSDLKKRRPEMTVGPIDETGGSVPQYLTWLFQSLLEQKHIVPRNEIDEHQLLKRMFWTTFVVHRTCRQRHRKVICRRERNLWELNNRVNDTLTIDDSIKSWLTLFPNRIASPTARERCTTKDCRSPTTCTVAVRSKMHPSL
jgi:hypothetical protein